MASKTDRARKRQPKQHGSRKSSEESKAAEAIELGVDGATLADCKVPPNHCEITYKHEKSPWDRVKPFVEILGLLSLIVYTIYTIKMYTANREAADAAASAAKTAAATLLLNRAWVGVERAAVTRFSKENGIEIAIQLVNAGNSPAHNVRYAMAFSAESRPIPPGPSVKQIQLLSSSLIPKAALVPRGNTTLELGSVGSKNHGPGQIVNNTIMNNFDAYISGSKVPYLFGEVIYDTAGITGKTTFCLYIPPEPALRDGGIPINCPQFNNVE